VTAIHSDRLVLAEQRPLAAVHFTELSIQRQRRTGDDPNRSFAHSSSLCKHKSVM